LSHPLTILNVIPDDYQLLLLQSVRYYRVTMRFLTGWTASRDLTIF
jgi:hypothetical protein